MFRDATKTLIGGMYIIYIHVFPDRFFYLEVLELWKEIFPGTSTWEMFAGSSTMEIFECAVRFRSVRSNTRLWTYRHFQVLVFSKRRKIRVKALELGNAGKVLCVNYYVT